MFTLEESPLTNSLNAGNSGIAPLPSSRGKPVRFRSVFAGSISPMTPRYELWYLRCMFALNTVSMTPSLHEVYLFFKNDSLHKKSGFGMKYGVM